MSDKTASGAFKVLETCYAHNVMMFRLRSVAASPYILKAALYTYDGFDMQGKPFTIRLCMLPVCMQKLSVAMAGEAIADAL